MCPRCALTAHLELSRPYFARRKLNPKNETDDHETHPYHP